MSFDPNSAFDAAYNDRIRFYSYQRNIYRTETWRNWDIDVFSYSLTYEDYISVDAVRHAISILADFLFLIPPSITFSTKTNQRWFDNLSSTFNFHKTLRKAFENTLLFGDGLVKAYMVNGRPRVTVMNNDSWIPTYTSNNYDLSATSHSFYITKEGPNGQTLYLFEHYNVGSIVYEAYVFEDGEYVKGSLGDWREELSDTLVTDASDFSFRLNYNSDVNLISHLSNDYRDDTFFGASIVNSAIASKLKSVEEYYNLLDYLVKTNSVPPLQLQKETGEELKSRVKYDVENDLSVDGTKLSDLHLQPNPTKRAVYGRTYADTLQATTLRNSVLYDAGSGKGVNQFINNPFDPQKIIVTLDKVYRQMMSELSISDVFYDASVAARATSAEAYKRLMIVTLNKVERYKPDLRSFISDIIFSMMSLEYEFGSTKVKPEFPSVNFSVNNLFDRYDYVQRWVQLYNSALATHVDALQNIHNIDEDSAIKMSADIDKNENKT